MHVTYEISSGIVVSLTKIEMLNIGDHVVKL